MSHEGNDIQYHLAFSHFLGIGPVRFGLMKKHFRTVKKAYLASNSELTEVIGNKLAERFIDFKNRFDPVKKREELKKKGIGILCVDDKDYPESLRNISDPPICIYVKGPASNFFHTRVSPLRGPLESEKKSDALPFLMFAIVGTRQPTSYGIQITYKFSRELTEAGFVIVSGLAKGIDAVAHKAALDGKGTTIAVLGCGVDIVYPAENYYLYKKIIEKGSLIISEFPPGQFIEKGLFIARNRIISALSRGVMIVEGGRDSGSLITARYAAEQGKEVFAPPSPITSIMSAAPNILLKEVAKLVTSVEDILEEFNIRITPKKKEDILEKLGKEEKEIFILLNEKPMLVDDLVVYLKKPINHILDTLSLMEISGVVEKNSKNYYQVRLI